MSKKDFVTKVLELLQNKWNLATELKKLVEIGAMNNDAINALVDLFRDMAKYVKNKENQGHLLKVASTLENMKAVELDESIGDQEDAEKLLLSL